MRYIIDISYLTLTTTSQSMIPYDRWEKLGSMTLYPLLTVLARKWRTCDLNLDLFPKSLLLPITFNTASWMLCHLPSWATPSWNSMLHIK